MKVVQFAVPVSNHSIIIEEDILPYFYNYFHRHDEMQITLILKGEGNLIVDNYTQRFTAGDIYLISANQPHLFRSDQQYFEQAAEGSAHALHLYFNTHTLFAHTGNLPEMQEVKNFMAGISHGIHLPAAHARQVKSELQKIAASSGLPRWLRFMKLLHYFTVNLKEYTSLSSGSNRKTISVAESGRINKIYQYTAQHFTEDITLDMISDVCNMTPQAFCTYFKKHTSKTYITFLQEIRINAACVKIINGTEEAISSVAFTTGFHSAINFNKVFKKVTGISPTAYARKYRVNVKNSG